MKESDILGRRLINQLLVKSDIKTPKEVVAWLGAVQAQDYNMSKWAIGARLPGVSDRDIEDSINKGDIIRTHILRPTWHLVSSDDIYWMLNLTAPTIRRAISTYCKHLELTHDVLLKARKIIEKELCRGSHLTRQEMMDKFTQGGIMSDNYRTGHIMFWAEVEGIVCNGVVKDKKQTYCLLEERVPRKDIPDKEESLNRLARKYFTSHGPATLQDFVWWSGLTMTDAKLAMEFIKDDFEQYVIGDNTYWINEESSYSKIKPQLVHLLPAFDEFFVSYKDRKHILDEKYTKKVIVSNGVFKPMIISRGKVIGIWNRVVKRSGIFSEPVLFEDQDKKTLALLDKQVALYSKFNNS